MELIPGGADTEVNASNVHDYVRKYAEYRMVTSAEKALEVSWHTGAAINSYLLNCFEWRCFWVKTYEYLFGLWSIPEYWSRFSVWNSLLWKTRTLLSLLCNKYHDGWWPGNIGARTLTDKMEYSVAHVREVNISSFVEHFQKDFSCRLFRHIVKPRFVIHSRDHQGNTICINQN